MTKSISDNHLNSDNSSVSQVTQFAKGMKVYNTKYANVFKNKKPSESKKTKK